MARPVKWSRDIHLIRERASQSRTETWSRKDIERLFNIGRASAQNLIRAIGEVQSVASAHFVDRNALLSFLDDMISAESLEATLRDRRLEADAAPVPKPLRVALPRDLRNVMIKDLPKNIQLSPGRLEITAVTTTLILESLALLAQAMQNDLERVQMILEPPSVPPKVSDEELQGFLSELRG